MTTIEFDQRLQDCLITSELEPHLSVDSLCNGAQTWGGAEVKKVGFAATVPEAVDEVLECVDFVSKRGGGQGAIRELADLVFKHGAYSKEKTP